MSEPVIKVETLSKRYIIGHQRSKDDGFRHVIEDAVRAPLQWLRSRQGRKKQEQEEFWALKDVSFEVKQGEVLGIIGRNGAGKSTLLKILSRITEPTSGRISIEGRVASLLEVGTGFHPELTGRENIFLNGAILGMSRVEIKRKFDEIVAFSEVEKFLDTPVKRYSSGMYVRLAFAVAAHLEPEVLIVDEVLAVGDAQFQNKCLGKMQAVSNSGRTVIFVSHNMPAVASLCPRVVWLKTGQLHGDGKTSALISDYLSSGEHDQKNRGVHLTQKLRTGTGAARFVDISVQLHSGDRDLARRNSLVPGDSIEIALEIAGVRPIKEANVAITIYDENSYRIVDANTALKGEFLSLPAGRSATVSFILHNLRLKPGRYTLELWLGRGGVEDIDFVKEAETFEIQGDPSVAKHTETFPGVYQCAFSHTLQVK